MVTETKHYVEYLHAAIPFFKTSVEEVSERVVENVVLGGDKLGFRFFDKTVAYTEEEPLYGAPRNLSGWYYKGERLSLQDVKDIYGSECIVMDAISRLTENGYTSFVKTNLGQFIPLMDGDTVL